MFIYFVCLGRLVPISNDVVYDRHTAVSNEPRTTITNSGKIFTRPPRTITIECSCNYDLHPM